MTRGDGIRLVSKRGSSSHEGPGEHDSEQLPQGMLVSKRGIAVTLTLSPASAAVSVSVKENTVRATSRDCAEDRQQ